MRYILPSIRNIIKMKPLFPQQPCKLTLILDISSNIFLCTCMRIISKYTCILHIYDINTIYIYIYTNIITTHSISKGNKGLRLFIL